MAWSVAVVADFGNGSAISVVKIRGLWTGRARGVDHHVVSVFDPFRTLVVDFRLVCFRRRVMSADRPQLGHSAAQAGLAPPRKLLEGVELR